MLDALKDVPAGIFDFILDIWAVMKVGLVDIFSVISEVSIDLLGHGSFNMIAFLFGTGLSVYITVVVIKWAIHILL